MLADTLDWCGDSAVRLIGVLCLTFGQYTGSAAHLVNMSALRYLWSDAYGLAFTPLLLGTELQRNNKQNNKHIY